MQTFGFGLAWVWLALGPLFVQTFELGLVWVGFGLEWVWFLVGGGPLSCTNFAVWFCFGLGWPWAP